MRYVRMQPYTATPIQTGRHVIQRPDGCSYTDAPPFPGLRKSNPLPHYPPARPRSSPPPRPLRKQ
eukprot:3274510-Pleurochrysis_carterae.AAC.1